MENYWPARKLFVTSRWYKVLIITVAATLLVPDLGIKLLPPQPIWDNIVRTEKYANYKHLLPQKRRKLHTLQNSHDICRKLNPTYHIAL